MDGGKNKQSSKSKGKSKKLSSSSSANSKNKSTSSLKNDGGNSTSLNILDKKLKINKDSASSLSSSSNSSAISNLVNKRSADTETKNTIPKKKYKLEGKKTYKFETDDYEIAQQLSLKVFSLASERFETMERTMLDLETEIGSPVGAMAQYGVPGYLLDKLKCSLCYEYLSYAPIYYHPESGSVCGRHPVFDAEKDGQPIHEKNYEYLASMMSFPCRYRPNGCTGSFTMTQMPEHEEYCEYKPYFCPILPLGDCAWQGSPEELHGHFATCHQILLLEIPEFELDIVNNYKENYLIPISNELFLLRIVYQNSDQKFRCCLHYIGKPNLANNYEYEIIFKTKDVDSSWSHSKLIAESDLYLLERRSECVVDLPTLKEILHEPTFIKVEIKITKVEATSSVDDNSDLEDFSNENEHIDINELKIVEEDKLLESIECQVCQEYMIPPIYQCVIGHNICGDCKPKLNNCPTCKDQIGSTRNFALEKLTEIMKYPCKNIDEGCVHRTNSLNIRNHESECEYKPNECTFHLLQNCKWTGNISSLLQHCKNEHPNNIQKGIYFQTTYNPDYERYEMFKIKSEFGLLFKIMYSYTKEHVACTVQCITRPKDNSKLMYEMQIIDLNSNGLELLSKKMCGFISDNKDDVKHCTFWNMDMIKPFISQADVKLKFKCVIFKI